MRIIKKIFLWLLILVTFFIAQGLFLIYIYEDDIKQAAVRKINEQLTIEIQVGRIELSLFDNFPFVSVTFPQVTIPGTLKAHPEKLLEAKKISMLFNVLDLYRGNYRIRELRIENGSIHVLINEKGQDNYHIWKTASASENSFSLHIKDIELDNVHINYTDRQLNQVYTILARTAHLSGDFTSARYELGLKGDLRGERVRIDTIDYLKNRDFSADLVLKIDNDHNSYLFKDGLLTFSDLALVVNGSATAYPGHTALDLDVEARNSTIQSLLGIIPVEYTHYLSGYKSKGAMSFKAGIKGNLSATLSPLVNIQFSIRNGEISSDNLGKTFKDVQVEASYTNGPKHSLESSLLQVKRLSAKMDNNPFTARLSLSNFKHPFIDVNLNGTVGMSELFHLFKNDKVNDAGGLVTINATYKGLVSDFSNRSRISETAASGTIALSACHFAIRNSPVAFTNLNGNFRIENNTLEVKNFSGVISSSDFLFNGSFSNLLPYLLDEREDIVIEADLYSRRFNLDELLLVSAAQNEDSVYQFRISPRIRCRFKASLDQFNFRRFTATNVRGNFLISDQVLKTDFLALNAMNGQVYTKGSIDASRKGLVSIRAESSIQQVNIHDLFYQCENFGQEIIVDQNLKGKISAKLQLSTLWKDDLSVYEDQIAVKSTVLIENGELINFQPLMALSRFVNVNELKNLRFSALQNEIEIRDKKIYIPTMQVQSNALNLTLSGTHQFDNRIDYQLKILLSELLSRKLKKPGDEQFGTVENDGSGNTTLYLRMTGTASDPVFTLDKKAVKQKIAQDIQNERKEVKQVLKDEFKGWFNKDQQLHNAGFEEGTAAWEKDIPPPKREPKSEVTAKASDTTKNSPKSGWKKFKEKLNEPIEQ